MAYLLGGGTQPVVAAVLTAIALTLSGCTVPHVDGYIDVSAASIATHKVPYWRQQRDYFESSSYKDPLTQLPAFNSCMDPRLSVLDVCSRRGLCVSFDQNDITHPILFCKCNKDWSGPECNIRRKRQSVAWLLALLLGPTALDEMYLERMDAAVAKLLVTVVGASLGAAGSARLGLLVVLGPWLFDVVRVGMCPVHARDARLSADLPRWAFAMFTLLYFALIAVVLGVVSVHFTVPGRRRHWDQKRCQV